MEWFLYVALALFVLVAGIVAINRNIGRGPRTAEEDEADKAESQTFSP